MITLILFPFKRSANQFLGLVAAPAVLMAIGAVGVLWSDDIGIGPLSTHMAQHLATMSMIAPAFALLWSRAGLVPPSLQTPRCLWGFAVLQMALLWGWHAPATFAAAGDSPILMALMHTSLFIAALLFWASVIAVSQRQSWHAIAALLASGKLSCLLGALFVFAPRPLFDALWNASHAGHGADGVTHADQQLAGLLMVTACPLTYVAAAIWLTATWIAKLELEGESAVSGPTLKHAGLLR